MTNPRFSHPIAGLVLNGLADLETGKPTLDDDMLASIRKSAFAALKTDSAEKMADALVDVVEFLEAHGARDVAAKIDAISDEVEDVLESRAKGKDGAAKANEAGPVGQQFEGFDDDDTVEKTRGRRRAAAHVLGKPQVHMAPRTGDKEKPAGTVTLESLIGAKRRM